MGQRKNTACRSIKTLLPSKLHFSISQHTVQTAIPGQSNFLHLLLIVFPMKNQLLFNTVFPLQTFTSHTSATIIQGVSLYKTHVLARQTSVARISKKYITFYFFFFLHEPKMEDNFCLKKKTFFFFFYEPKMEEQFRFSSISK